MSTDGEGGSEEIDSASESISLADELLPEFYELRSSVREDRDSDVMMVPPPPPPADSTSFIVRDLVDRVERLSRENACLKQSSYNGDLIVPPPPFNSTPAGPEHSRVSFFELPLREKSFEPLESSHLHERLVEAIDRHREAVDDLRDVLKACWAADTQMESFATSYLASRGPSILRWKAEEAHRPRLAPSSPLVNLRKPIWFRDLRTNE